MITYPRIKLGLNLIFSSRLFSFPGLFMIRQLFYQWAFGFQKVKVEENVWFTDIQKPSSSIKVGRNVVFQRNTTIDCTGGVEIADNVVFSKGCTIFTHAHNIHDRSRSWRIQGEIATSIRIETDVWVGTGAIILPSVDYLGEGAIIGAGAIVTKDVEAFSIVAGNPARVIGHRE